MPRMTRRLKRPMYRRHAGQKRKISLKFAQTLAERQKLIPLKKISLFARKALEGKGFKLIKIGTSLAEEFLISPKTWKKMKSIEEDGLGLINYMPEWMRVIFRNKSWQETTIGRVPVLAKSLRQMAVRKERAIQKLERMIDTAQQIKKRSKEWRNRNKFSSN